MELINMPKIMYHDIETNEIIEREMNAEELAQKIKDDAELQQFKDAEIAKAKAKADLLLKLGITEDEARLLLG